MIKDMPPEQDASAFTNKVDSDHKLLTITRDLRSRFRPQLGLTLTTLVAVTILLSLGTWQIIRLQQKNQILREVRAQLASAPRDLRHHFPPDDQAWRQLEHQPVRVQGTWLPVQEMKLAPRTFEEQVGYHLVVPLQLNNGQTVLVNRGFVRNGAVAMPQRESGVVQVFGVVRVPETVKANRFTPDNIPERGQWVWVDLPAMGRAIGVGNLAPVMIYQDRVIDSDSYPIGGQLPLPLNNRHQQYAVTWYCLALAFIGVWIMASTPKNQQPDEIKITDIEDMSDPVKRRGLYPEATD